jgi:hypothetical protein
LDVRADSDDVSLVLEDGFEINQVDVIIHEFNESLKSCLLLDLQYLAKSVSHDSNKQVHEDNSQDI